MVIVRLIGGLGNQMFQYAAGLAVAKRLGVSLKLDISDFKLYPDRKYALHCFNIEANIATQDEIYLLSGRPQNNFQILSHLIKRFAYSSGKVMGLHLSDPQNPPTLFVDAKCGYDANVERLTEGCYLSGYWQSEMYFSEIADTIRSIYRVKHPLNGRNLEVAEMIQESQSASIHIRRGDYAQNPMVRKVHGLCKPDYYKAAVKELLKKYSNLKLFIFSDDPCWVRENIDFGWPTLLVDHNPPDAPWEDLRLMTLCQHHVIANSSFSWWGAWLGNNNEQIVIAPKKWYLSEKKISKDRIPGKWKTISIDLGS